MMGRIKIIPSQIRQRDKQKKRREEPNIEEEYQTQQGKKKMLGYFSNEEVIAKLTEWIPGRLAC